MLPGTVPDETPPIVRNRTVFYISGYDGRGPAHYHALYRDEAARQAGVNGLTLEVGALEHFGPAESGWTITAPETTTRYVVLRYDDIVRRRWSRSTPALIGDILAYAAAYATRSVFGGLWRHGWRFMLLALLAPALLLLAVLAAIAAGLAVAAAGAGLALAILAGLLLFWGLCEARRLLPVHLDLFWLTRVFRFTADQGTAPIADVEARIDSFARRIAAEAASDSADEIIVAGHSIGCQIAVSALARLPQHGAAATENLSLLTLGSTLPLLGLQPGAASLRQDLLRMAESRHIGWWDVSAPADWICCPLTDPLSVCGVAQPDPARPRPEVRSARFHAILSPASYASLRRDIYRAHFQFLAASERPGGYDYFQMTAGPMTLRQHFDSQSTAAAPRP